MFQYYPLERYQVDELTRQDSSINRGTGRPKGKGGNRSDLGKVVVTCVTSGRFIL